MLRLHAQSMDLLDWLLLSGLLLFTVIAATFALELRPLALEFYGGPGAAAVWMGAAALLFSGVSLAVGYLLRARVVYAVLLVLAVFGLFSFFFTFPSALLLFGLLRKRNRQAFFSDAPLESAPDSPAPPPAEEETQVFRARSFEQDQTVLMQAPEPLRLAEPPPAQPKDDPTVPDGIDVVTGAILAGCSGLAALLAVLLGLGAGLFFFVSESNSPVVFACLSALCAVSAVLGLVLRRGLESRARWAWALGVVLGLAMVGSGNLPVGALLLFTLLRERGRVGFGVQGPGSGVRGPGSGAQPLST